jgi:hypothetical protein
MAADLAELSRIFSDDHLQYDESGWAFTQQDILDSLKTGDRLHPLPLDGFDRPRRSPVGYVYTAVLAKRNRHGQIVASQLAKPGAR